MCITLICMYLLRMFGYMHLLHIFFIYIYNEMTDILDKFVNTTFSFPEQCANAWLAYTLVLFFLLPLPINFRLHLLVRISQWNFCRHPTTHWYLLSMLYSWLALILPMILQKSLSEWFWHFARCLCRHSYRIVPVDQTQCHNRCRHSPNCYLNNK